MKGWTGTQDDAMEEGLTEHGLARIIAHTERGLPRVAPLHITFHVVVSTVVRSSPYSSKQQDLDLEG